jgi:hypothetical protein
MRKHLLTACDGVTLGRLYPRQQQCRVGETMTGLRVTLGVIGATAAVVAATAAGASAMAQTPPSPAETILAGSGAAFTAHTPVIGAVTGSQRLSVELG